VLEINKYFQDWYELIWRQKNFDSWLKKKFSRKEAIISYLLAIVGLGIIFFLLTKLGIQMTDSVFSQYFDQGSLRSQLFAYVFLIIDALLIAWFIPSVVKTIYKVKKRRYDYFTNFFRIKAALTSVSNSLFILLTIIMILLSVLKSFSVIIIPIFIIIAFIIIIIGLGVFIANIVLNLMLLNRTFGLTYGKAIFVWIVLTVALAIILGAIGFFVGGDPLLFRDIIGNVILDKF